MHLYFRIISKIVPYQNVVVKTNNNRNNNHYNTSTFFLQAELQLHVGVTTRRYIKRTAEQISENTASHKE